MTKLIDKNFVDVTKDWLDKATPNSHIVKDAKYFKDKFENKYYVDGKNVVLDYSLKEKEIAFWLENIFGGEIYMLPRINIPEGISTPDYLFNGEYWDLKTIIGDSMQTIYHAVRNKSKQSNNFIFEILNNNISLDKINKQIYIIYKRTDIPFIDKIILKKEHNFWIYKRM